MITERGLREDVKTFVFAALFCRALYSLAPIISEPLASLLAVMPLTGALVRFRINHEPKQAQHDTEEQNGSSLAQDVEERGQDSVGDAETERGVRAAGTCERIPAHVAEDVCC